MLSGLVISIGGLQDSLKRVSLLALLKYLEGIESEDPNTRMSREYMLSVDILWVLQQYKKCNRVIIPTLKVLTFLRNAKLPFALLKGTFRIFYFILYLFLSWGKS